MCFIILPLLSRLASAAALQQSSHLDMSVLYMDSMPCAAQEHWHMYVMSTANHARSNVRAKLNVWTATPK